MNLGGHTEEETPGTIPNPEVKLFKADDTSPFWSGKVGSCLGSFFCPFNFVPIVLNSLYMSSGNNFNIAVFVSGSGTNLQAIIDSKIDSFQIAVIICNNPEAYSIERAKKHDIPIEIINHKEYDSRKDFETEIISRLDNYNINLIVLAGFMRVLSEFFVERYKNKIINIHPALLPSFPGMHAARQALEYGVKYTGVTVHFVDYGVDTGPIILQAVVPISEDDTEQTLLEKLHKEEHRIYPLAIKLISENKLIISGRNIKIKT